MPIHLLDNSVTVYTSSQVLKTKESTPQGMTSKTDDHLPNLELGAVLQFLIILIQKPFLHAGAAVHHIWIRDWLLWLLVG